MLRSQRPLLGVALFMMQIAVHPAFAQAPAAPADPTTPAAGPSLSGSPAAPEVPAALTADAPLVPAAPALPAPAAPAAEAPVVTVAPGKGLTVTNAEKTFSVTFRSRIQLRETFVHNVKKPGADVNTNEVNVKTLRFITQGYVLVPELKFLIQLAFGGRDYDKDTPAPDFANPIFDAFVEYVKLRDLNVRVGQYFVPFDRARTIREFALQFVDRQNTVRELTLDRDVGIMLSSQDLLGWKGRLGYHLFVGGGEGRSRFGGQKMGPLVIGRLMLRPMGNFDDDMEGDLLKQSPKLAIGLAGGFNSNTNRANSTIGSTLTNTFDYTHAAADVVFKAYGFSFLGEFVLRHADRNFREITGDDGTVTREYSRSGYGYFVQAGQMATDELEVTARWDDLYANKGTDPVWRAAAVDKTGRQAGLGLNYYLNSHAFKLQADYFYIFGRENTDQPSHAIRAQLDASF